ncbi:PepSY domain-containing protein [Virgisporangium ochraceum]|uniref:PepSY domain-containing protein n=1 Tax=Virgisporangium ochraceum TaxID=65505 RepID=A0A8J4E8P8_9ACTN|nr:PepSY domain-containing protein [Virgisporangium ochraceum]GIJ65458.1 hypothetical protein Voc01_003750 [Virgisporangium ochraceum]
MKRKALAVAGATAVATVMIGGAALAAAGDDDPARGRPAAVAVTDSPSPDDTPSPTDTASPDDSPTGSPDDSPTTTAPAQPGGAVVPSDLAAAAALARVGGGTVTSVESEFEHGRAVWKVRIVKDGVRYDVHVDKETGAITRFENKGGGRGDDDSGRSGHDDDNSGSGRSGRGGGDDHGGSGKSGRGGDD